MQPAQQPSIISERAFFTFLPYNHEATVSESAIGSGKAGALQRAHEDAGEHGAVEAAGVGVAQGGVVAGEKVQAVGEEILGAVGEACTRICG